jgi:hypothetical protein
MQVNSSRSVVNSASTYTAQTSPEEGTTVAIQSQETVIAIESGTPESDAPDGMAVLLGGEATAVGENTTAVGIIEGQIADVGGAQIAEGSATFAASGQTSNDAPAYAFAESYVAISEADTTVLITSKTSETLQSADGSSWAETSTTEFLGIEVDLLTSSSLSAAGGPEEGPEEQWLSPDADSTMQSDEIASAPVDGNLAVIIVDVQAYAEDTLVLVDVFALVIEDELSVVSGSALFGVG